MAVRAVLCARSGTTIASQRSEGVLRSARERISAISRPASFSVSKRLNRAGASSSDTGLLTNNFGRWSTGIWRIGEWNPKDSGSKTSAVRLGVRADAMAFTAAASQTLKIIGISGSLRKSSTNSGLLRAAVDIVKTEFPDVSIEILDISTLPFLNTDLEVDGTYPESVAEFRSKVLEADGVLFASPEYNYSVTGVLKNAVDWASRSPNVWADKGAAIVSSGGGAGGARSSYHLRQSGVYIDLHFINKPEMFVRAFEPPQKFDQDGNLVDERTRGVLKEVIKALRAWIIRLKH